MNVFIRIEKKGKRVLKQILAGLLSPPSLGNKFKKPDNVIIVRIDERLGNLVLLNSVVKSFIKNNIETSLVICKKYGRIYQFNHNIKEIIYFNKKSLYNPINIIKLIIKLRKQTFDLMFDASNPNELSFLTFFVMLIIKAGIKLGYKRQQSNKILNKLIPVPKKNLHILEYYTLLFKDLNLKFIKDITFKFPRNILTKYDHLKKKKIIIVHPGGRYRKQWGKEKLLFFLDKIKSKKYKFIILLGPDEYELKKFFLIKKYNIIKPKNIIDLISVLSSGKIYIGNDSGPMHLAASLGLAVFAVFQPVASVMFTPVARNYKMVISDHPADLSVQEVYKKYRQFMKKLNI